ncbi:MAG: PQQ-binding-like beta-propeller repeat protein [Acidobacteriota bacterium]|nr:PQQ-binding-like beta-propeller repeat protein [Acidobacteriota bacterium]
MVKKLVMECTRRKFLGGIGAAALVSAWQTNPSFGQNSPQSGLADWSRFGYDLHNTRFNVRETTLGPGNVGRLKPKWIFDAGGRIQTCPTVIGDTLFFGSRDGYLYSLDTATGVLRWKFKVEFQTALRYNHWGIRSSPQYSNGRIYFGDNFTKVYCLDAATGEEIWETQLSTVPLTNMLCSVAVYDGKVLTGYSSDIGSSEIACLDAETGAVSWRFRVVPESQFGGGSVWTSPAIDEENNIVYNVTGSVKSYPPSGTLYAESILAHDLHSGELLWYYQAQPKDAFDLDFSCHPMIFDAQAPGGYRGKLVRQCVGAANKRGFFCWNRYTGELYWKAQLTNQTSSGGPLLNSTAVAYNRIFVVSNALTPRGSTSVTAALNAYTGDIEWWIPNSSLIRGPVAVANGVFYQGFIDGIVEAVDAESGRSLWSFQLPSPHRGGIAIANGALYTSNGQLLGTTEEEERERQHSVYAFTIDGN